MANSPRDLYHARLMSGELRADPAQAEMAAILQILAEQLEGYRPASPGILSGLLKSKKSAVVHGLYLYGDVGRGKSMLMDLFFDCVNVAKKRRVHFHQFMLEIHARLHRLGMQTDETENVITRLAGEIADDAFLLCFDEFHVSNIADAMILGRLFSALFDAGVVIVTTSNWPPEELYKNGLQRDRFLPFIDLIKSHMTIHRLAGAIDHRFEQMRGLENYFYPLGNNATEKLKDILLQLIDGAELDPVQLPVQGRIVTIPCAAKGVAYFTFDALCRQPLGAAEYVAIAECFHTLLLDGVPHFNAEQRNEIVRFTTLIDALYEAKVKFFMTAEGPPEQLCPLGEQAFDFQRTISRLVEMQSEEYRHLPHLA